MGLPWWSKYDAQFYRALSVFPDELEGKYLDANNFVGHFKDFYGRPVQDIIEALHVYGEQGYFKADTMLSANYLESSIALDQVTIALDKLRPKPEYDKRHGLSESVYAKVIGKLPLTLTQARNLPDGAKPYLEFKLSKIDKSRLREELVTYDNSFQPSRLVKHSQTEPSVRAARVVMDGSERRYVRIVVTGYGEFSIAKLQVGRAPFDFMHYLYRPENSETVITIKDIHKEISSCRTRKDMTELVGDCGFDKALKKAFFPVVEKGKVRFRPTAELDAKQFEALKKRAAEFS